MSKQKFVVLGTGGTIAGVAGSAQDGVGYTAGQLGIGDLLTAIPGLEGVPVEAEQVAQLDSKDMDARTWQQLALRCAHWLAMDDVGAVVITHGTDTLEETAYFLQRVLAPSKPVVLTCAMRPATAVSADGPRNLADAFAVAASPGARGVVAVCAGVIHGAHDVAKVHPYRLDAFASRDAGPLGFVEEGRVRLVRGWEDGSTGQPPVALPAAWPRVEIVMSHAGAGRGVVDALVAQGVQGLVVATTGNGTVHAALEAGQLDAQRAGVSVLRATRCAEGAIVDGGSSTLPSAAGLSPVKARVALMLALMSSSAPGTAPEQATAGSAARGA